MILVVLVAACAERSSSIDDYPTREIAVGGKTYGYRVFVPKNRDPKMKLPVMLYLHGSGSRGNENREQAWAFDGAIGTLKEKVNFIVVMPQCADGSFWSSVEMSNYALAALDTTVSELNGDPERLYLAGFSLGGYGTWQIAAANPGKFAALMPVAGGVVGERPVEPRDRAAIIPAVGEMLDSPEPYKAIAEAIGPTPVWVFHGAKDDAVPVDFARRIVKALEESGNKSVKYTEYIEDGHIIAGRAFSEPGFFEWLAEQRLSRK
jgi:predicted peptidase